MQSQVTGGVRLTKPKKRGKKRRFVWLGGGLLLQKRSVKKG